MRILKLTTKVACVNKKQRKKPENMHQAQIKTSKLYLNANRQNNYTQ